ncbi:hypothetical protein CQA49_06795 [Helicobacter sp. MIT 00-7814]|uniref:nucleotidyl transferase AbiEii/AbiGii toxin family protein n=1 Tax=unclassified Helicobacter TaxID=2593540 RepID=UPI000E1E98E1|nr:MULTISPECIES: nucleotidyl transferase AbiEii/AbiGii toxin family protein [unclassified Helicobacter]RDU53349.1 hypothetical protein CQA49_06795 [Helicobacter sp. MIT 00-7814]RDU54170.1 hypothetical protein CQA37_06035 [Helicobacter sp. MIT 99-10781]
METKTIKPRLDILPPEQLKIYQHLGQITKLDFTLFGGTALALQLGHRQSIDFDFFAKFDIDLVMDTLLNLNSIKADKILQQDKDTLVFITDSNVKLSFFGGLDFVESANKVVTDDKTLIMADIEALLATKLKATCDRAEYKDYFDIASILKHTPANLTTGLENVSKFFGDDYPSIQILKGLTYFEDGDLYKLEQDDKEVLLGATKEASSSIKKRRSL